jgi:T-complex protein 1 subunit eta
MEVSKYLREVSRTIEGKQQLMMGAFAKALEVIPRQICDNAGIDATDVLNKLRMLHSQGDMWAGVDVEGEGVGNNFERFVWEPSLVKINAIEGAAEAACLILSVDETVTNPQSQAVSFHLPSLSPHSLTSTIYSNNPDLRLPEVRSVQSEDDPVDDK